MIDCYNPSALAIRRDNKCLLSILSQEGVNHVSILIARFMGPIWGPSGADRTQVGPMWDTWTLLSGSLDYLKFLCNIWVCSTDPFSCISSWGYMCNLYCYHQQTESINLSQCCHIFPWWWVWFGCTIILCSPRPLPRRSLLCVQMIGYIMTWRLCSCVCTLNYFIIVIFKACLKA